MFLLFRNQTVDRQIKSIGLLLVSMREEAESLEVLYKKGVHKNFSKFTGKHSCQCLFFNKVAGTGVCL